MRQEHPTLRVDRVRGRMAALGLDQLRLAEKAGMTSGAISRLLASGGGHVSSLKAMAEALECSADYLLGLSDAPEGTVATLGHDVPDELRELWGALDRQAAAETVEFMRFKAGKPSFLAVDEQAAALSRVTCEEKVAV